MMPFFRGKKGGVVDKPAELAKAIEDLKKKLDAASLRTRLDFEGATTPGAVVGATASQPVAAQRAKDTVAAIQNQLVQKNLALQEALEGNPKIKLLHDHLLLAQGMPVADRQFLDQIFQSMWQALSKHYSSGGSTADTYEIEFLRDALNKISATSNEKAIEKFKRIISDEYCRLLLAPIGDESPDIVNKLLTGLEQLAKEVGLDLKTLRNRDRAVAHAYALQNGLIKTDSFSARLHQVIPAAQAYQEQTEFLTTGIYQYAAAVVGILGNLLDAAYVLEIDKDPARNKKNENRVRAGRKKLWQQMSKQDPLIAVCVSEGKAGFNVEAMLDLFIKNPEAALKFARVLFDYKEVFKKINSGAEPTAVQMAEYALYKSFEVVLQKPDEPIYRERFEALKAIAITVGVTDQVVQSFSKLEDNSYNPFLQQLKDYIFIDLIKELEQSFNLAKWPEELLFLKNKGPKYFSSRLDTLIREYKLLLLAYKIDPEMNLSKLVAKENDILQLFASAVDANANDPTAAKKIIEAHGLLIDKANAARAQREQEVAKLSAKSFKKPT